MNRLTYVDIRLQRLSENLATQMENWISLEQLPNTGWYKWYCISRSLFGRGLHWWLRQDTYTSIMLVWWNCGCCPTWTSPVLTAVRFRSSDVMICADLVLRYVNKDRSITKRIVQHAEKRGIKGLFITVDAPQLGRREKVDHPHRFWVVQSSNPTNRTWGWNSLMKTLQKSKRPERTKSTGPKEQQEQSVYVSDHHHCTLVLIYMYISKSFIDPGLQWSDLEWFKSITNSKSVSHMRL